MADLHLPDSVQTWSLYHIIQTKFNALCNANFDLQMHIAGEPFRSFFIDERGRFRIWASSVGVHLNHNDSASLDHRLQYSLQARSTLLELLQDLDSFLAEGLKYQYFPGLLYI